MSRRHGKSGHAAAGKADPSGLRRLIEQLLERGQYKEALKQARVNLRQEDSAENRQLFERASVLRAEELARNGLQAEAKDVTVQLLDLGVTDSRLLVDLLLLLPRINLGDKVQVLQAKLTSSGLQAGMSTRLADEAVLHGTAVLADQAEVEAARQIRAAVNALQQGRESEALAILPDVPRSSPLAEWRFFVRGLAAYGRNDDAQALANWERLDPARPAHAIASQLRHLMAPAAGTPRKAAPAPDVSRLESAVFGGPWLANVQRVKRAIDEDDWKLATQALAPLRQSMVQKDRRLAQRLTEALLGPLAQEATSRSFHDAQRLVQDFTRAAEPLAYDPHWNRLWALLWEQAGSDSTAVVKLWQRVADDLEGSQSLPVGYRSVQAMVWRRIGEIESDGASPYEEFSDFDPGKVVDNDASVERAVAAFKRSLQLDPMQHETYDRLVEVLLENDRADAAAEVFEQLLVAFPHDLPALEFLVRHYVSVDLPIKALPLVQQARQLKPLDDTLRHDEWSVHMQLARHAALAKRWEEGRAALARAESLATNEPPLTLLTRKTIFEFKAGETERAEELLSQAQAMLADPTSLWLQLSIEAMRYRLPTKLKNRFQAEWRRGAKGKTSGATAGRVAEIISAYQAAGVEFPDQERYRDEALEYVSRSKRARYEEKDLQSVCVFLNAFGDEDELEFAFVKRGLKQFKKSPFFLLMSAELEFRRGPYRFDPRYMEKQLRKALALAEAPGSSDAELAPRIKQLLMMLDEYRQETTLPGFDSGFGDTFKLPGFREIIDQINRFASREQGSESVDDFDPSAEFQPERRPKNRKR